MFGFIKEYLFFSRHSFSLQFGTEPHLFADLCLYDRGITAAVLTHFISSSQVLCLQKYQNMYACTISTLFWMFSKNIRYKSPLVLVNAKGTRTKCIILLVGSDQKSKENQTTSVNTFWKYCLDLKETTSAHAVHSLCSRLVISKGITFYLVDNKPCRKNLIDLHWRTLIHIYRPDRWMDMVSFELGQ